MRKVLFNLHLYVALIAGVFIAILGLTGSIMAFETEIDRVLHWKLTYVTPQSQPRSLTDLVEIVAHTFPDERIRGYGMSASPDLSYQINTVKHAVFVNQYTGQILGTRSGPDWVSTFIGTVHQLHLRLLIHNKADTGKLIESCAGLATIFLSLSGLYLWWPVKRMSINWKGGVRRLFFDLHNVFGIASMLFLLIFSTTGCIIGFEEITTPLFFGVTKSQPIRRPPAFSAPHAPDAKPLSPDKVAEIARNAVPGAIPFGIDCPGPGGVYFVRARFPEDLTPGGRSQMMIDQYSGKVLFSQSSREAPGGVRMVVQNRAIHTGDIFGMPSKIVMSLASLMVFVQLVSGLVMWWKRPR